VWSTFLKLFCTCSPSSLGQILQLKLQKKEKIVLFLHHELEMADLSIFSEKYDLRPLGVKKHP
jgi:hypothetical protein